MSATGLWRFGRLRWRRPRRVGKPELRRGKAVRITKVYTRGGDDGETSLANGERTSKASLRVCAYGEVDELNSFLGLARTRAGDKELQQLLAQIQNDIFVLGADLAAPVPNPSSGKSDPIRRIGPTEVESLEKAIDRYNEALPPLKEFILPAGNEGGALLHVGPRRGPPGGTRGGAASRGRDPKPAGSCLPQSPLRPAVCPGPRGQSAGRLRRSLRAVSLEAVSKPS